MSIGRHGIEAAGALGWKPGSFDNAATGRSVYLLAYGIGRPGAVPRHGEILQSLSFWHGKESPEGAQR
jgi:hypothetical protein